MTDFAIVSRQAIRDRAREAFNAGKDRDAHQMNWHAPAVKEWQQEWDDCQAELLLQVEPA